MSFTRLFRLTSVTFLNTLLCCLVSGTASMAVEPRLRVVIPDVYIFPGQPGAEIPVYLDNPLDTVAGFNLWIQLDRPDIISFDLDTVALTDTTYWSCNTWNGTTCVDSTVVQPYQAWDFFRIDTTVALRGAVDTAGTLISGWEYLSSRSLSGFGHDLNTAAIADLPDGSAAPLLLPQTGGPPLMVLLTNAFDVPDTLTDRTVNLLIYYESPTFFCFSTPAGQCIGFDPDPEAPIDSIELIAGSVTALVCGDLNDDIKVNVADLTLLVGYLFQGAAVEHPASGDLNGTGNVNISDLTELVRYLFEGGARPLCYQVEGGATD